MGNPPGVSSDVGHVIDEPLQKNQAGFEQLGVYLVTVMGDPELTEKSEPVCFAPQEFKDLAGHVNPCAQPIPRDFLRFDCAPMEQPTRGIFYESDH